MSNIHKSQQHVQQTVCQCHVDSAVTASEDVCQWLHCTQTDRQCWTGHSTHYDDLKVHETTLAITKCFCYSQMNVFDFDWLQYKVNELDWYTLGFILHSSHHTHW